MLNVNRSFNFAVRGTHDADSSGISDVWMLTDSKFAAIKSAEVLTNLVGTRGPIFRTVEVEDHNQCVIWASYQCGVEAS